MAEPNGYIQGHDGKPIELVDATARRGLAGKLDAPDSVKAGDYLRVQSIGADGTVVLEGAEGTGNGSGQNPALTAEERSTLIAVVNAIGSFDETNGRELLAAFNAVWGGPVEPEPEEPEEPEQPDASFQPVVADALIHIGGSCSEYTYSPNGARMMAYASSGDVPFYNTTDKYPIKIPAGATTVSVVCPGFIAGIQVFSGERRIADPGWGALDGTSLKLSDYPTATSIVVGFKSSSNTTIPKDTDTSGISILFE